MDFSFREKKDYGRGEGGGVENCLKRKPGASIERNLALECNKELLKGEKVYEKICEFISVLLALNTTW